MLSRRSCRPLRPMTGGPHGDLGAAAAVPGDFGQAEPLVERAGAAVDRQHVENQVLALALCLLQKRADERLEPI